MYIGRGFDSDGDGNNDFYVFGRSPKIGIPPWVIFLAVGGLVATPWAADAQSKNLGLWRTLVPYVVVASVVPFTALLGAIVSGLMRLMFGVRIRPRKYMEVGMITYAVVAVGVLIIVAALVVMGR